jgi:hypothetical protein
MSTELIFALISTWLLLIGIVPLWRDIIKGRTIPHPFTTWIWVILVAFNLFVLIQSQEYLGFIPNLLSFVTLFAETAIWIIFIRRINMNWFDGLCLSLAIGAILYFLITRNTLHTVIATVIIDGLAFLPTYKKWWLQPWTETSWNYFIGGLAQLFVILSLSDMTNPETYLYWGFVLVVDMIFVLLLISRRYYLKWWKSIFE